MKHNKKRNTAFLYEALIRELAKTIISKDFKQRKLISLILREHFEKGSLLYKELRQYKEIYESKDLDPKIATRLVSVLVSENEKIDKKKLFVEQSKLISRINRELNSDVLKNFVPNYKNMATIYQLFNSDISSSKERVILESKIVDNISIFSEEEKKEFKPMTNLIFKTFVKEFNETYDEGLLLEQKQLLSKYIGSIENNGLELKIYLNEEIGRLKNVIKESLSLKELKEDREMKEKTNEVLKVLNEFNKKPMNKEMMIQIMKIQQLAEEVKEDDGD